MMRYLVIAFISIIWVLWFFGLLFSQSLGIDVDGTTNTRFAVSGDFGDSFGAIAALMATIAAICAYLTYLNQQRLHSLERFESNFFTLLGKLESITSQILVEWSDDDVDPESKKIAHFRYRPLSEQINDTTTISFKGRKALSILLFMIRDDLEPSGFRDTKVVGRAYKKMFDSQVGQLAHYFRTLYHIYKLISEKCPENSEYYCRIVRATLSNSELRLIAYNCVVGKGRGPFEEYLTDFSILHNIHREGLDKHEKAELDFFLRKLPKEAFRFEEIEPVRY